MKRIPTWGLLITRKSEKANAKRPSASKARLKEVKSNEKRGGKGIAREDPHFKVKYDSGVEHTRDRRGTPRPKANAKERKQEKQSARERKKKQRATSAWTEEEKGCEAEQRLTRAAAYVSTYIRR